MSEADVRCRVAVELPRPVGLWRSWVMGQLHCPFCAAMIEESLIGLSTLLGPSLLQCRKCARLIVSHRREWRDRSMSGRVWYVLISVVYVLVCAVLAFLATLCACAIMRTPALWVSALAAALWAMVILGVQVLRVVRSLRRTRLVERPAVRATFWSLDFYLPQKVLRGTILSAIVLAFLARLVAHG
jgi:hypothetical protein